MADARPKTLLSSGATCWRIAEANRFALIVDGCDYYHAVKQAMLNARHQILMVGWHFDTRTEFQPQGKTLDGPNRLGPFISWLRRTRPDLEVKILQWDWGIVDLLKRGFTPLGLLRWLFRRHVTFRLDSAHPLTACHHQKVIVIDDAIAFCGGIDLTAGRWDTRQHLDVNPARRSPRGRRLPPWHDATSCVDGPAAAALGRLLRERWQRATAETLTAPPLTSDPWPKNLPTMLRHVPVGISRTIAAYNGGPQINEIESLTLRAIRRARKTIYIESQYFASRHIAEAMLARLQEKNGPEIVVVTPLSADGWLPEKTMGGARARLLRHLRRHDPHRRFHMYYPVTAGGQPIYVHAKLMIIDDVLFKVGSSNLNNRSMGFDTECDLTLDAARPGADGARQLKQTIRRLRDGLLAEHLGVSHRKIVTTLAATRSVGGLIEKVRRTNPRLVPLDVRELDVADDFLAENDLMDPERRRGFYWPLRPWRLMFNLWESWVVKAYRKARVWWRRGEVPLNPESFHIDN